MQCDYFDAGVCHSCTFMGEPYEDQLARKQRQVASLLSDWPDLVWEPAFGSRQSHFRNKAKLVVGGTADKPTLGILDSHMRGVDLRQCGLYEPCLAASFETLAQFVQRARITPFDVATGRGELKNILATTSPSGTLMLRFVLRSTEALPRIRKNLGWLQEELPQAAVITANLLPERKAVPEGREEIVLTDQDSLPMQLDDVTLFLRPQSFFQTNTPVAKALYGQARDWVNSLANTVGIAPLHIWDLYCGVGGFALNVAGSGRDVLGVEISEQAVESARLGAATAPENATVRFMVGDANAAARAEGSSPDILIVNPPRRGIGALSDWIEKSDARWLIYSSCNANTLAKDLTAMPSYQPHAARLFDMFPQTSHSETMVLAQRMR
ncbi:methyltransferase domain-containing protein [Ancrocorticia populi]|uniref:methyltransferase domain-containing protein n=1 Tax=Ancrocorticia populi TaxID=2175228 RepID=UPI002354AD8D|nr:methyltransferase domain-containing protein [Ancrocorticia populi]